MKETIVKYNLSCSANKLNKIILSEIQKNVFKKRHKLYGEVSKNGGFDFRNRATLIGFDPDLGAIVRLNLTCVDSNIDGTKSILRLERVNGLNFYIQYYFTIFFTVLSAGVIFYQILINKTVTLEFFFIPLLGIIFHFIVRAIAKGSYEIMISNIEKMMNKEKIEYVKQ